MFLMDFFVKVIGVLIFDTYKYKQIRLIIWSNMYFLSSNLVLDILFEKRFYSPTWSSIGNFNN